MVMPVITVKNVPKNIEKIDGFINSLYFEISLKLP